MSAVDASQPTLPVEILTQIFQDYFTFRIREIEALHDEELKIMHGGGFSHEQQEAGMFSRYHSV